MSNRQLRKIKEKELETYFVAEEEIEVYDRPSKTNIFALLAEDIEESEEQLEVDSSPILPVSSPILPVKTSSKSKSKKKKKNKKQTEDDLTLDDLDKLIAETAEKFPEKENSSVSTPKAFKITVDPRFLNAETELKRMFGSRVIQQESLESQQHRQYYQQRPIRSLLAHPKDPMPPFRSHGLGMECIEDNEFRFTHSTKYQAIQRTFFGCVATFDPNTLVQLLQQFPFHVDAVLQMSDYYRQQGDMANAAEIIERALCAQEKAFHFKFSVTTGECRLLYSYAENRAFFLSLFRHINLLGRKGCYRTGLEYCKIVLSLDRTDPLAASLLFDFYALKSGEFEYFIAYYDAFKGNEEDVSFAFSTALCKFMLEKDCFVKKDKKEKTLGVDHIIDEMPSSSELLQRAIQFFPDAVVLLYKKCGMDTELLSHLFFTGDVLENAAIDAAVELYAERNYSLWKETGVLQWLESNVSQVVELYNDGHALERKSIPVKRSMFRHIIMSDFTELTKLIPSDLSQDLNTFDPLSPAEGISVYEQDDRGGTIGAFLRRIIPWNDFQNNVGSDEEEEAMQQAEGDDSWLESMRTRLANFFMGHQPEDRNDNQNE